MYINTVLIQFYLQILLNLLHYDFSTLIRTVRILIPASTIMLLSTCYSTSPPVQTIKKKLFKLEAINLSDN